MILKFKDDNVMMAYDRIQYIRDISGCKYFNGDPSAFTSTHKERLKVALEKVLDIRNFEIDLYWKRA